MGCKPRDYVFFLIFCVIHCLIPGKLHCLGLHYLTFLEKPNCTFKDHLSSEGVNIQKAA